MHNLGEADLWALLKEVLESEKGLIEVLILSLKLDFSLTIVAHIVFLLNTLLCQ